MHVQLPLPREAGYRLVLSLLLLGWCAQAGASNVVGISPITDRIIQVHFDDGHIDYGKGPGQGTIYNNLLDTTAIYDLNRYLVTSPTDGQFGPGGRRPTHVGRKTKAGEVNDLYSQPNFVLEHWVYLQLPSPLKEGNTYTLSLGGLATNTNTLTFSFDAANLRSEAIHVTQLGVLPDAPKYAYISQWMGDFESGTIVDGKGEFAAYEGKRFDVVRVSDGTSVFNGTVQARKRYRDGSPQTNGPNDARSFWWPCGCDFGQNHSFSDVLEADFSSLNTPGDYKVVVQDMGSSYAFEISDHAYRDPFNYVLRGIGFQRQGVVLDLPDGRIRPRDFHPDDYPASRFRLASNWRWVDAPTHDAKIDNDTKIDKQYAGELPVWGWYHDAGDWDAYPQHGFIPLMLNILYDMKPGNFRDGDVGMRYKIAESDANWIDEGSNGLPDILDEASWLLRYWKRAKDVGLARGVTTGGVPGAYGGADAGALDGFPSWGDNDRPLEFVDEGPFATYQYAAVAAQYAYNLRSLGRNSEADSWLSEARSAWSWANNNIQGDDNTAFNGLVNKMRSVAAAALYKETKEAIFQQRLKDMLAADSQYQGYEEGWGSPHYWEVTATIYGLLNPADYPNLDRGFQDRVREHITTTADQNFVDPAAQRGYRYGFDDRKAQQIGMSTTPMLLTVIAAAEISSDRKYFETINTTSNFFLGGNQDHKTWISGLGERPVRYPFHPNSWFLYDFDSKVYSDESLPGYVPYGSSMQPDFFGWGYLWAGDEDFSKTSMYPYFRYQNWPAMEQRVGTRYSIPSSEFTVWQNMATSAFTYGYLNRPANSDFQFNDRPTVTVNVSQTVSADGGVLTASTSGDTRHVKYYYEENFIGESFDRGDNFSVFWDPPLPGGTNGVLITAVAYDDKGLISLPGDAGDKSVNIVGGDGGGTGGNFDQDDGPDGLVSLETEEHSARAPGSGPFAGMDWTEVTDGAASNGAFMVVPDNRNSNATEADATAGPRLDFVVDFVKTGTHYVWIRQRSPNAGDNSVNFGYNRSVFTEWNMPSPETTWRWSRCPTTFSVAGPGTNTFNVFMREDATPIDRIVLTANKDYNPNDSGTGTGPGSGSGGCSSGGTIRFERFNGITGRSVSDLQSAAAYPNTPTPNGVTAAVVRTAGPDDFVRLDGVATPQGLHLSIFPNPSTDGLIQLSAEVEINATIEVLSTNGQVVSQVPYRGLRSEVRIDHLGLFLVRVLDKEGKLLGASRIVVQ